MNINRIDIFCSDGKKYTHLVLDRTMYGRREIPSYFIEKNSITITTEYSDTFYPVHNIIKYEVRRIDEKDPEFISFCKTFNLTKNKESSINLKSYDEEPF